MISSVSDTSLLPTPTQIGKQARCTATLADTHKTVTKKLNDLANIRTVGEIPLIQQTSPSTAEITAPCSTTLPGAEGKVQVNPKLGHHMCESRAHHDENIKKK